MCKSPATVDENGDMISISPTPRLDRPAMRIAERLLLLLNELDDLVANLIQQGCKEDERDK